MMRSIKLDYASSRSPSLLGLAVFVLAFIIAVVGLQRYNSINQQLQAIDSTILHLKKEAGLKEPNKQVKEKSSTELLAKMDNAKKTADFLLIPWGDVFSSLESAALADSALLSVEPDSKKRQLKITAEAKNKQVMFNYMQRLEATPKLSGVYLLKHEMLEDVDQHPVRFVLAAKWGAQ
jgi:hypothetical protein